MELPEDSKVAQDANAHNEEADPNGIEVVEEEFIPVQLDEIIDGFYASLLPDESALHQDFPKEDFPHNVNIRMKVVRREEIPYILNPPKAEPILGTNEDNLENAHEENGNLMSGSKRFRDTLEEEFEASKSYDDGHKRAKFYE
mmetsp:Transcript_41595/g.48007  ORF Transcript_41595/g.48007 Transcript_41595/m.48007 type:complete len:143 (-) Transcript_41595:39-467(-)